MRLRPDLSAAAVIDAVHQVAWAPFDQYDQDHAVMETCQRGVLRAAGGGGPVSGPGHS